MCYEQFELFLIDHFTYNLYDGSCRFGVYSKKAHQKACVIYGTIETIKKEISDMFGYGDIYLEDYISVFVHLKNEFEKARKKARIIAIDNIDISIGVVDDLIDIFSSWANKRI